MVLKPRSRKVVLNASCQTIVPVILSYRVVGPNTNTANKSANRMKRWSMDGDGEFRRSVQNKNVVFFFLNGIVQKCQNAKPHKREQTKSFGWWVIHMYRNKRNRNKSKRMNNFNRN